jgi:hypothetical protein
VLRWILKVFLGVVLQRFATGFGTVRAPAAAAREENLVLVKRTMLVEARACTSHARSGRVFRFLMMMIENLKLETHNWHVSATDLHVRPSTMAPVKRKHQKTTSTTTVDSPAKKSRLGSLGNAAANKLRRVLPTDSLSLCLQRRTPGTCTAQSWLIGLVAGHASTRLTLLGNGAHTVMRHPMRER